MQFRYAFLLAKLVETWNSDQKVDCINNFCIENTLLIALTPLAELNKSVNSLDDINSKITLQNNGSFRKKLYNLCDNAHCIIWNIIHHCCKKLDSHFYKIYRVHVVRLKSKIILQAAVVPLHM